MYITAFVFHLLYLCFSVVDIYRVCAGSTTQRKGWEGEQGMFPSGRGERDRGKTQKRGRGDRGGETNPGARPSSWNAGLASVPMCSSTVEGAGELKN